MAKAQPCPQALNQSQGKAAPPSPMASAASGQALGPAPGARHLQGHLQCSAPWALLLSSSEQAQHKPAGQGRKQGEFWPFRSCALADQILNLLPIHPVSHWGTGAQLCQAGRTPRWEHSFVFFLVEM